LAEPQVRAAVRLMLGCGMREAEVLGARWEWLDAGQGEYRIGKAKGMKPRTLGVPDWVLPWILALPRTVSGLVFPGDDGRQHPAGWLRKALARGARAAGVVGTLGNHRLRASFATRHAAAGTATDSIQAMMGHRWITTTQEYIEPGLDRQKAAQDALAGILKKGS
jgi:integrase